ncbi:MAG: SDR family NAD(P)-dependent oxidoreductase, partial [Aliifodinibius sp.]|nr:SDR family NAD(P)-dependent oxidoreductase [Fodinibius sp.]NIV15638.1 SDR family NAD(P)-dependent oxidoreductase [Fodinibius sp.]NIY29394.1 SDR family NAD(P)-dependent oxidoreductase [Fodinibius sp.]
TENHTDDIKRAKKWGFIESAAGDGKVASASRKDYAEAAAKVLTGEG